MKYVEGNLVEYIKDNNIIIHGTNAMGVMGAGVAKALASLYPYILVHDVNAGTKNPKKLGTINYIPLDLIKGHENVKCTVINACTQFRYGTERSLFGFKSQTELREWAIREAFKAIKAQFGGYGFNFFIPKIGAGLAGGNWSRIETIINQEMRDENVTCVLFKQ